MAALLAIACMISVWRATLSPAVARAQAATTSLRGNAPGPVIRGLARLRGARSANAPVSLNVDLATREPGQLDELIRAASTPGSPSYGHYLTPEQYRARFAPTSNEVGAAETWLRSQGLHVAGASPDNSLVHVTASTATAARAFGLDINNYTFGGRDFYANDRSPSVPSYLHVDWVSGLSNYNSFQVGSAVHCVNSKKEPVFCGYFGSDFRTAYDLTGSGEGQTIGFTLWGRTVPQSDYTKYAADTGTTALTVGGAGANGLEFVQVGGASTINAKDEVALDTEVAHAVAPGIHETYWLGVNNTEPTLETVLNDAANSKIAVISNSWGFACSSVPGGFEKILQAGVSTGKTFYFASGDNGAEGGTDCLGLSPNAVAVGGTELHVGPNSEWSSENALLDDGGCSKSQARPAWQVGVGSALEWPSTPCSGRAIPDVSADSCYGGRGGTEHFGTECGAFVFVEGSIFEVGGTSLSAPIWAGASAVWDNANAGAGRPGIGFVAPLLYSLGNDPTTDASDFHDIQTGSNGFAAAKGWDEATGWGSPNFNDLANNPADINYTGPSAGVEGQSPVLSATLYDHGTTHGLEGRKIKFAVGAESCEATTSASGAASCSVALHDPPGSYSVSATFAGDTAYSAASTSHAFTIESGALPTVSKLEPKEGPEAGAHPGRRSRAPTSPDAKEVKFGATPAKSFKVESASVIAAEAPAGKGTVAVTVTTTAGTSASGPASEYTYLAPPTVSKLEPKEGSEAGGTLVTITGANLTGAKEVKFGATPAKSFKVESASVIAAEAPAGKGTVAVTVTTTGGTSAVGPASEYTYLTPPTVSKLEPKEGPEAGGTQVTITGANLTGAKEVKFGSTPAKGFKVESASVIAAESPAGKGTVAVTVTTTGGTSAVGPASEYTYLTPPAVTTLAATQVTRTTATLNGTVNPNGSEVSECRFEYGTTMLLGSSAACTAAPGSGTNAVEVSAPLTGLEAETTYYFRLVARNASGTSGGLEELFTTKATASPPEFGRCLKAAPKGTGAYKNAGCTKPGGTHSYAWYAAFESAQPLAKAGFTAAIKELTEVRLESAKQLITCKGQTGEGEYDGTRTVGDVVFRFTACQHAGASCQSGLAEGEIETQRLAGTLGVILSSTEGPSKNKIGLGLQPGSGGAIAEFSCGGTPVSITGAVIAEVKANSMQLTTGLWTFAMAKGGKQKPEGFEGGAKQTLQLKFGAGEPEQAGLSLKTKLGNDEKVEVNSVV